MEVFAAEFEFDRLGLNSSYNPDQDSFVHQNGGGVPVREVKEKQIPSRQKGLVVKDKFDTFTGIIDGVTGEPLHGVRHYSLTGEEYEGKFKFNGIRHGEDAIVKNIALPPPREVFPDLLVDSLEDSGRNNQQEAGSGKANFFGTYKNDEPSSGNLVTGTYIYRGSFVNGYFHGGKGELIRPNGYHYLGDFQEGLFHGMGREIDPESGDYQGEFCNGMKQGIGTLKELKPDDLKCKEESNGFGETENLEARGIIPDNEREEDSKDSALLLDEVRQKVENVFTIKDESVEKQESMEDISSDRYVYSGHFNSNQCHGEGTEWTPGPNGEMYSGQFYKNRRHGHGSLKSRSTGTIYEGKWCGGDAVVGNGWRILYPNGDIYCGHVKNYEPHGYGMYQNEAGVLYVGHWKNGHRCGTGIRCNGKETEIAGEWTNDNVVTIEKLEATDKTLGEIANVLRTKRSKKSNEEVKACQDAGDATEEDQNYSQESDEKKKETPVFSPVMTKSIETSLQIIASHKDTEDFESFSESPPETVSRSKSGSASAELNDNQPDTAELHSYANRDIYLGALDPKSLQRTGYGVYVSRTTGCSYTGLFENNKRHGFGILIHSQFGKYAGEFREDKKHGEGTLILRDSSSYHGNFVNGIFEGKGTLRQRDGGVYVGEWKAGLRNGEGMETMDDGQVYKGTFKKGKREGNGTLLEKYAGKIIYRGQWLDDKYHGEGMLVDRYRPDISPQVQVVRWEGEFKSGEKHGYGVLSNEAERSEWKGNWSHDRAKCGKWRIRYADGGIFSGRAEVLDGYSPRDRVLAIPEGFGTFKFANGDVYIGNFEYGLRSGNGSCQFISGEHWEGVWMNDEVDKNGGVLTSINGEVKEYKNTISIGSFFSSGNTAESNL